MTTDELGDTESSGLKRQPTPINQLSNSKWLGDVLVGSEFQFQDFI